MYNEYYFEEEQDNNFGFKNINLKGKIIIGGVLLLVLIIAIIIINNVRSYYNSYGYLEKQMVESAKNYISKNNYIISDEVYLRTDTFEFTLNDECNKTSGVFIDSNYNYQAYLSCDTYQSDVINNNNPKISLNGEEVIFLAKGINYQDPGVKGMNEVVINGEVGTEEGVYNLSYFVRQNGALLGVLKRKVVIIDDIYIKSLFPTITLKGEKIVYLQQGSKYIDSGVLAGDSKDFDLSSMVKVDSNIDTNQEGEYEVTYTVTNSRGYTNRITRKVVVVNNFSTTTMVASLNTYNKTNSDVTINIKIIGEDYDYLLLPDKTINKKTDISYVVRDNGTYNFVAFDKDGKSVTKIISVTNIDKEKPTAVCQVFVYKDYSKVFVTPNSGKKISKYNYLVNGVSSGDLVSNNYQTNISDVTSASVIVKDSIGNSSTSVCEIIDMKTPVYLSNRCTSEYIYEGTRYSLSEEQKKKLAAMVYAEYASDLDGMKAVASHMANLYEYKTWGGYTHSSFYDYITTTGWYAERTRTWTYYNDIALQAVNDCIVNGNRTLPLYIDEFDMFPNDIYDPLGFDSYVRDLNVIRNKYGAIGKFWCLSLNQSNEGNIFFYTSENYKNLVSK